ncbi:nucleotidyl transferase AbiEii/AbiGii toxin family protein [Candidatus Pacearchaeota archaeon]|nr:nucleotidyl transferase AbiEii/AbiGii toxin family protein [Candidatus Pacearchaeota archaeon]
MVKIPIILMLKKESQKKIARAQDIIVEEMEKTFNKIVLHGGTAIWRCYNGNRFSEDVDVYIPKEINKINNFFENLKKRRFILEKKKIGKNSLYSSLRFENIIIRFEALFKLVKGELKDYETVEGNLITIHTLLPEELIKEKINAYLKRLRVRDLYDIFFLLRHVKDKREINSELKKFLKDFKNPVDKEELKLLIISGLTPNIEEILRYINREMT